MSSKQCSSCGNTNASAANFCTQCGNNLSSVKPITIAPTQPSAPRPLVTSNSKANVISSSSTSLRSFLPPSVPTTSTSTTSTTTMAPIPSYRRTSTINTASSPAPTPSHVPPPPLTKSVSIDNFKDIRLRTNSNGSSKIVNSTSTSFVQPQSTSPVKTPPADQSAPSTSTTSQSSFVKNMIKSRDQMDTIAQREISLLNGSLTVGRLPNPRPSTNSTTFNNHNSTNKVVLSTGPSFATLSAAPQPIVCRVVEVNVDAEREKEEAREKEKERVREFEQQRQRLESEKEASRQDQLMKEEERKIASAEERKLKMTETKRNLAREESAANVDEASDAAKADKKKSKNFLGFIRGGDSKGTDEDELIISAPGSEHTTNGNGRTSPVVVEKAQPNGTAAADSALSPLSKSQKATSDNNADGGVSPVSQPSPQMTSTDPKGPNGAPALPTLPQATDQRSRVITEVLVTEADYIRDLEIMVWMRSEMVAQEGAMDEINTLFSNVTQLLMVNHELFKHFSKVPTSGDFAESIANGFISMAEFLKTYVVYCSNQQKALQTYNALKGKNAATITSLLNRKECRSLAFDSFLIKPVQRVCKYPLLLRELIKSTPSTTPAYNMLVQAQSKIESIVTIVNERKREYEGQMKMYNIQTRLVEGGCDYKILAPSRKLVKEGNIECFGHVVPGSTSTPAFNKKSKPGYYYLFNDLFIFVLVSDPAVPTSPLKLKASVPFDAATVREGAEQPNSIEMRYSTQRIWLFATSTPEEKQALFTEISQLVEAGSGSNGSSD
ncbi:hypothetical protein SAMD00019534_104200 [Acytostelium subglobosum LB1]|uniref:hypothetical protein n=1 Tax=Acytostelium subglobosum LB1 TaxID=1410327 RepID=UPI000644C6EF|nr:hypothetical protein SAMD00019534_104200 [Acytostelium subglobosum LB1]GAM27245.1 hypothetical protein SAMD00019534_104200 [Acytostelium subglobosum LB1]|eukprot:XP_012749712.1 hypothetical protein SAMD00019534_104200 [Acytostelium subglobosum LB1]